MDFKVVIEGNKLDELMTNNKILNYLMMFVEDEKGIMEHARIMCEELKKECKLDLFDEFKQYYEAIPIGLQYKYLKAIIHKNITTEITEADYEIVKKILRSKGIDDYDLFNLISDRISARIIDRYSNKYSEIPDFISDLVDENKDDEIRRLIDALDDDNDIKKFIVDNNIIDNNDRIRVFKLIITFLRSNYIKNGGV
jgi:hypothetical protein